MKWQFQKEDHNRKDKAKKPDYSESFADAHDSGGSHGLRITLADIF